MSKKYVFLTISPSMEVLKCTIYLFKPQHLYKSYLYSIKKRRF